MIEACKTAKGLTRAEIAQLLGRPANNVINIADLLVKEGRLHKSGVRRAYRYFTDKAHADAWALVAKDAYAAQLSANREATRITRNESRRTGNPMGRPAAPVVVRQSAAPKPAPKPTKVIWPEHVKVYVAPTPPGRFHFEPPPGWAGEISKDWMNRRTQGAGA
jgi:hypothetical protein